MISTDDLTRVTGTTVVDNDGDKIGTAREVYVDDATGRPEWVTVNTGLFGTSESFIPLAQAELHEDGLRVPYDKKMVKDAPRLGESGHLSPQEEDELYRYYGMSAGGSDRDTDLGTDSGTGTAMAGGMTGGMASGMASGTASGTGGTTGTDRDTDRDVDLTGRDESYGERGTVGHDTSGPSTDDAMTRSEERLDVGTESQEVGRARLRKYVTTETQTVDVPVSKEEVRLEREPITDANAGDAYDGPAISEEEHEVTLREERPVVTTETVPVERVRMEKETVTGTESVSGDVRKEHIETEGDVVDVTDRDMAERDNRV